jgi:HAD superfamily hydrolase (TIGR01490 family)
MTFAAFDLDGALYTGHIIEGVMHHHRAHRAKRLPLLVYIVTHFALWPLWRLGLMSELQGRQLWIRDMGWTIRGWTVEEAAAAFAWIAEQYVLPRVRPDVMERLWKHQARGDRVVIVSGTLSPMLHAIGRALGVEETVGTPTVLKAGRHTGASQLPTCQGAGKVTRLKEHLGGERETLWRQSYAYADSFTDLPLLEQVGRPVAVYPDAKLAAHARSQGWQVLGE